MTKTKFDSSFFQRLMSAIVDIVIREDNVTFPELQKWLAELGYDVFGDRCIYLDQTKNVLLWDNLSEDLCDAIVALIKGGSITPYPPTPLMDLTYGRVPELRRAPWPPKREYSSPRWLPSVLRTPSACIAMP